MEEELRQYFLFLHTEKHVARSTATVALSALKFLFEHTLRQPFPILDLIRPRPAQALPIVLSRSYAVGLMRQCNAMSC